MGFKEDVMDSLDSCVEVRMGGKGSGVLSGNTVIFVMFICFVLLLNGGIEGWQPWGSELSFTSTAFTSSWRQKNKVKLLNTWPCPSPYTFPFIHIKQAEWNYISLLKRKGRERSETFFSSYNVWAGNHLGDVDFRLCSMLFQTLLHGARRLCGGEAT